MNTKHIIQIVEPASAILTGNPNERHIPSSSTHEDICKFQRPEDPHFKSLWKQIDLAIDSALEPASLGDPGARTSEGSSTILLAASANQPKVMELLLRLWPEIGGRTPYTPL